MSNPFKVGDRVRFTTAFLQSTGQYTGPEPFASWTVQACDCKMCADGAFVAVNEHTQFDDEDDEPMTPRTRPYRWRHININNLEKYR